VGLEPSIWPLMLASLSTGLVSFEVFNEGKGGISLKTPALLASKSKLAALVSGSGGIRATCLLGMTSAT